jgi:Fe-S-cluster-containing dehydrogenase component
VQIYNRCIGTRYCSNNCPYKVRRFNYYEYSKYRMGPINAGEPFTRVAKNLVSEGATSSANELSQAPLTMLLNPVVTVRSKGVMEKCNFCVQRTRDIREGEKVTNKKYQDGSIKTACAQTCPTDAITFGDINDNESEVSKLYAESLHAYHMLDEELNTRPSVAYLRRMRNRPATKDELAKLDHHEAGEHGEHGTEGEAH